MTAEETDFVFWRTDQPIRMTHAKAMRKNQTPQEKVLWNALRGRAVRGHKFRRQYLIDPYIADFACLEVGIVIEVDGDIHESAEHQVRDRERTAFLESRGFRVMRFTNMEISLDVDHVVTEIGRVLDEMAGNGH